MTTDTPVAGAEPTTIPTAEKKPRAYSVQSKKISDVITSSLQLITTALEEPEILVLVSERGYTDAELRVGLELQSAAQTTFDARQEEPGSKAEAKKLRDEAFDKAFEDYSDYRKTVQAVNGFTASDRATLGADGKLTRDLQKFVTNATAAYQAAQNPPYTEILANRSYTIAWLDNAIASLKTLADHDSTFTGAKAVAKGSTDARDAAVDALTDWVSEFRTNAKIALKDKPVLLGKLGL
jgi:hypothetical protein